ncbi:hypothetical protein ACIQ2D_08730 [Lysinibacillus sp. NPDC097287]|uniref:hypothetical protein n=1 Tax=Lysinibacillus sp. NPDC097287 TaxID=3364144 RepID=UPI0037F5661E
MMDIQMRKMRIEILDKIDALTPKCKCQSAEDAENCSNCKLINQLGQVLKELLRPRNKKLMKDHDYPENKKKPAVVWTKEMVKIIEENAHKYTYKELAEILKVPEKSLRTKCSDLGFKCKKLSVKYKYYENDILIATGFIPEIAKITGLNDSTLRNYAMGRRLSTGRRMEKINEHK